jgi:hypothetical protein
MVPSAPSEHPVRGRRREAPPFDLVYTQRQARPSWRHSKVLRVRD